MACCKLTLAIKGGSDCLRQVAGFEEARIGALCSIAAFTKTAPPTVIDLITMEAGEFFFEIDFENGTLNHEFDTVSEPGKKSVAYNNTITGMIADKNSSVFEALDEYQSKEVVIIGKEKGSGAWRIIGQEGGLFVTQVTGATGAGKTDDNNTTMIASGETDDRWLYVFDTDAPTTDALIDTITSP